LSRPPYVGYLSYPTCAFISAGRLNGGDDCTNLNSRLDAVVNGPAFVSRWGQGLSIVCFAAREAAFDVVDGARSRHRSAIE
jgi:hypothetical protein